MRVSNVIQHNGEFTKSPLETLNYLLDISLPGSQRTENHATRYGLADNPFMRPKDPEMIANIHSIERTEAAINEFQPFKSPGPDGLYSELLQKGWNQLKGYYNVIFQACLRHSNEPSAWKEGTGIFLSKPGKENYFEAKSFRMITLTSFLLKWLERLILYHINEDINEQAKLPALQYGFQAGVSMEAVVHESVRRVEHRLVRKKPTLLQMPADRIKKTKVFERNFKCQIMGKKNAIRSESVLNQNTVKIYTDGLKPHGRVGAGFYAEYPKNSPKQAFFHLRIHSTVFQAEVLAT